MPVVLTDDRKTALRVGYLATDWNAPITYNQYKRLVADWTISAICKGADCIGAMYKRDGEVHVSILPEHRKRWATRGILKQIFDESGTRTKVTQGHEFMFGVLERIGLKHTGNGEFVKG